MSIVWRENRSDLFIGLTSEEEFVSTHEIITIGIDAREDLIDVLEKISLGSAFFASSIMASVALGMTIAFHLKHCRWKSVKKEGMSLIWD